MDSTQSKSTNGTQKLSILIIIVALTLGYAIYEKRKIDSIITDENHLVLEKLPSFSIKEFASEKSLTNESIFKNNSKLVYIHFWGTWCGPCEVEFPDFVKFTEKLNEKNVSVLLLAVKDEDKKIKKFLARFKNLPENVILAHDEDGSFLDLFGTVKVPETFIFAKNGKHLNKYVGPQDWNNKIYTDQIDLFLNKSSIVEKKIETH